MADLGLRGGEQPLRATRCRPGTFFLIPRLSLQPPSDATAHSVLGVMSGGHSHQPAPPWLSLSLPPLPAPPLPASRPPAGLAGASPGMQRSPGPRQRQTWPWVQGVGGPGESPTWIGCGGQDLTGSPSIQGARWPVRQGGGPLYGGTHPKGVAWAGRGELHGSPGRGQRSQSARQARAGAFWDCRNGGLRGGSQNKVSPWPQRTVPPGGRSSGLTAPSTRMAPSEFS